MLNLYPYNSGHLMIIPYRHQSDMSNLSESEMDEMMHAVQLSMRALDITMKPHGLISVPIWVGGAGIDTHLIFMLFPDGAVILILCTIGEVKSFHKICL